MKPFPSIAELRAMFRYHPNTGIVVRLCNGRVMNRNVPCGCGEYRQVGIAGRLVLLHRLAWALHYGEWPPADKVVDHKNRDATDHRACNLRLLDISGSQWNKGRTKANTTGLAGVSRRGARFTSTIKVHRVSYYLGTFDTPEEAHTAYLQAKRERHPTYFHGVDECPRTS